MSWWSRLINVLRSDRLADDLDDEQRFHIEARADDLVSAGLSREDALREASRRFGRRVQLREASRDARILGWLDSLVRDVRFGVRLLRRDAVVSLAAIVSLGLAIGACTAAFSLIDAVILRRLPIHDPQQLVYLTRADNGSDPRFAALVSYPFYQRMRRALAPQTDVFSMSHQSLRQAVLPDAGGQEEKLEVQFVSGNAFGSLRVKSTLGRLLLPSDDLTPGGHPVAVVSHAFWTRRLGANPAALGMRIEIEQVPYQIVGVAQDGFTGAQPGVLTDVWLPNLMFRAEALGQANNNWLQIWGRLGPGATREAVRSVAETTLANFEAEFSETKPRPGSGNPVLVVNDGAAGYSPVRLEFQRPLLALAVIVGIVLLIACSNVANLLLARGAARAREMALRASIGAGRARLLQQVLVESSVVTFAATVLGVVCAYATVPLIVGLLTTNEHPVYLDVRLDWRVLAFVALLGCATTILFGLMPAIRASAAAPGEIVVAGNRRQTAQAGMARSLVAAQIAFSLMVLFVTGLLLRSFDRLLSVDLGFIADRLVLVSIEARDPLIGDQARNLNSRLLERVRALPGVESASLSGWALFRGWSWGNTVKVRGGGSADTFRLAISPDFFRTMGIRLLEGRELRPNDSDEGPHVPVVVNETFVRKYLSGGRAVGRELELTRQGRIAVYQIVGVAGDTRDGSVRGHASPFIFAPNGEAGGTIEIRTSMDPRTMADLVRRELPLVHPSLRLVDVTRQTSLVQNTLLRERLLAVLSGFFAALGLALAAVGLYGVSSYAVVRRTREIGIRLALGAPPVAVVRSVLGRMALAVTGGVIVGLAGGLYFARFVQALLFEIEPASVASLALPVLCLAAVALIAAWSPARRAMRVDPAEALRAE